MANTGTDSDEPDGRTERVLHVRFREGNEERIEETLAALDRDETPEPYFECTFERMDDLHRVTRPKNLELLRVIVRRHPESIRETARLVERDVRQVHRNLTELERLGLIDFEQTDQSKRPRVWYDRIEVDLPLDSDDTTVSATG